VEYESHEVLLMVGREVLEDLGEVAEGFDDQFLIHRIPYDLLDGQPDLVQ
jgi:hypothetical protein